jgi:G3E family GTPase
VSKEYAEEWKQNISDINPTATIYCTIRSQVEMSVISPIRAYEGEVAASSLTDLLATRLKSSYIHNHNHEHHHHSETSSPCQDTSCPDSSSQHRNRYAHTHHIDSLTFELADLSKRVSHKNLKDWLADLLWSDMYMNTETLNSKLNGTKEEHQQESSSISSNSHHLKIFRMKGILHMEDSDEPHFLQCVQQLFDISEGKEWPEGLPMKQMTRILIMGVGVEQNRQRLQKGFDSMFVPASQ